MPARRIRRSGGASFVEYIVVLALIAMAGIAGYRQLGGALKCRVSVAAAHLVGDSAPQCAAAGNAPPLLASNGPPPQGSCAFGACNGPDNCFVAGTLVLTDAGPRAIESIAVGMRVLAADEENPDAVAWKPVARTSLRTAPSLVALRVADAAGDEETVTLTPEHRLFAAQRGWVRAAALVPGEDLLRDAAGAPLTVRAAMSLPGEVAVYNLAIADYHTYFVSRSAIWAHNACDTLTIDGISYTINEHDVPAVDGFHGVKPEHVQDVCNQVQRPSQGSAGNADPNWKAWYLAEDPDHAAGYGLNDDGMAGTVVKYNLPKNAKIVDLDIPHDVMGSPAAVQALKQKYGIPADEPLMDGLGRLGIVLRLDDGDGRHELIVPWSMASQGTATPYAKIKWDGTCGKLIN